MARNSFNKEIGEKIRLAVNKHLADVYGGARSSQAKSFRKKLREYVEVKEASSFYGNKSILDTVRKLVIGFNIPLTYFNDQNVYHETLTFDKHIVTEYSPEIGSVEVIEELNTSNGADDFAKNYSDALDKYINGSSRIVVYDYLGRGFADNPNAISLEYYEKAKGSVFEKFQQRLESNNSPLRYERYLALPVFLRRTAPLNFEKDIIRQVARYTSPRTFKHIHWCLHNKARHTKIFAVGVPTRLNTYAVFYFPNGEKYILFEKYKYDPLNSFIPDLRIIMRIPNQYDYQTSVLAKAYEKEIKTMRKTAILVKKGDLKLPMTELYEDIRKSYPSLVKKYEDNLNQDESIDSAYHIGQYRYASRSKKYRLFKDQLVRRMINADKEIVTPEMEKYIISDD